VVEEVDAAAADYLPPKQERALLALLSSPTQKEAALASGISETTLWRYMKDSTFKRRLREAGSCAVNNATLRVQKAAGAAVFQNRNYGLKAKLKSSKIALVPGSPRAVVTSICTAISRAARFS
jgi:hypothetical protein